MSQGSNEWRILLFRVSLKMPEETLPTQPARSVGQIAFCYTDERVANQDTELIRALRPGMFTIKGAILVALSLPHADQGILFENYAHAQKSSTW